MLKGGGEVGESEKKNEKKRHSGTMVLRKTHLKISKMVSLPNVTTPKSEMVRLLNASKPYK